MVSRPNSNAYFDRSPGATMALQSIAGVLEARRGMYFTCIPTRYPQFRDIFSTQYFESCLLFMLLVSDSQSLG